MVFLWLSLVSGILSCPVLVYDDSISESDTCMTGNKNTCSVSLCPDSLYCKVNNYIGKCEEPTYAVSVFPGSFCDDNKYFCVGDCSGNLCKGKPADSYCTVHFECDLGLACLGRKCIAQLETGQSGCFEDLHCQNNAFCHNGKCIDYFSLEAGQPTDWNFSYFHDLGCKSGISNQGVCVEFPNSLELVENNCKKPNKNGNCIFRTNDGLDFIVNCICQLTGYDCGAIFDQKYQQEFIKLKKEWYRGDLVKNCHTQERNISQCMQLQDPDLYDTMSAYEILVERGIKIDEIDPKLVEAMMKSSYFSARKI